MALRALDEDTFDRIATALDRKYSRFGYDAQGRFKAYHQADRGRSLSPRIVERRAGETQANDCAHDYRICQSGINDAPGGCHRDLYHLGCDRPSGGTQAPPVPILALTPSHQVAHSQVLVWGIHAVAVEPMDVHEAMEAVAVHRAREAGFARSGDHLVVTAGLPLKTSGRHQCHAAGPGRTRHVEMRSLVWPLFGYELYISSGSEADGADISGWVIETRHLGSVDIHRGRRLYGSFPP